MCGPITKQRSALKLRPVRSSGSLDSSTSGSESSLSCKRVSFSDASGGLIISVKNIEQSNDWALRPGMRIRADRRIDFEDDSAVQMGTLGRVLAVHGKQAEVQMDDGTRFDADPGDITPLQGPARGKRVRTRVPLLARDKTVVAAGAEGRITKTGCPGGAIEVTIDMEQVCVTVTRGVGEEWGAAFSDDLRLMCVHEDSAADHCGMARVQGWRVHKVGNSTVSNTNDVVQASRGKCKLDWYFVREAVVVEAEPLDLSETEPLRRGQRVKLQQRHSRHTFGTGNEPALAIGAEGVITGMKGSLCEVAFEEGPVCVIDPAFLAPAKTLGKTSFLTRLTSKLGMRRG
eukprot:Sspe_Gene.39208::Locus_18918_Transcript_1_1_Confidence_1.000_Length_1573::g.39208::m.39208